MPRADIRRPESEQIEHDFSSLARAFCVFAKIPAEEFERLTRATRVQSFVRGEILLRQGEPANWLGYLERGLLRIVSRTDDREINLGFELEGAFVGAYDAYLRGGPSQFELEALEDGLFLRFDREILERLTAGHECWRELSRRVAEDEFARKMDQQVHLRTRTPEERYAELERTRSVLLRRVPQYHLASFLGVTPETLSRIRARMGSRS